MAQPVHESYWNQQRDSLVRVRSQLGDERRPAKPGKATFQPLADTHPLLAGSRGSRSPQQVLYRGNNSRTPPSQLPRIQTPPEHKHDSRVRGVRFGVLPNVSHYHNGYHADGGDSWGEEESDDDDYPQYPQMPFTYPGSKLPMPVVMYPMIIPQPQPTPRKSKDKGRKKVRVRNSPVYLNSRDNTLHEPQFVHKRHQDEDRFRYPYDGGGGYLLDDQKSFSYITPHQQDYDPFNPDMNAVLARYTGDYDSHRNASLYGRYGAEPRVESYFNENHVFARKFAEDLLVDFLTDDMIPDILNDVISEQCTLDLPYEKRRESPLVRHSDPPHSYVSHENDVIIEKCAEDLLNETLYTAMRDVVHDSLDSYVTEYMAKAAVYDVAVDIVTEVIEDFDGPDIANDAMAEVFFEDLIQQEIINPEVKEQSQEVIKEVCDNYNDKRVRRNIRQIRRDVGDKLLDSMCLDYLIQLSVRQGKIWTMTEYINKQFYDMITEVLIKQYLYVAEERRNDIESKPVRRHHEKMCTDVAVDTLLGELCASLDEDMADLDEYEMDMQRNSKPLSHNQMTYPHVEKALQGL